MSLKPKLRTKYYCCGPVLKCLDTDYFTLALWFLFWNTNTLWAPKFYKNQIKSFSSSIFKPKSLEIQFYRENKAQYHFSGWLVVNPQGIFASCLCSCTAWLPTRSGLHSDQLFLTLSATQCNENKDQENKILSYAFSHWFQKPNIIQMTWCYLIKPQFKPRTNFLQLKWLWASLFLIYMMPARL